jgi:glycosyltransferase involved in cell wall biosynthesis
MKKRLIFTVTNDLNYDQRMQRICTSLANQGYDVILVGRKTVASVVLAPAPYKQKRLRVVFNKGKLFYIEFNFRLFCWLLFRKADLLCAIDLDTILPVYLVSRLKRTYRVYDAHELFCEMKEIVSRPGIYAMWKALEEKMVPAFSDGYTVNEPIAAIFKKNYHVNYEVIRNVPYLEETPIQLDKQPYLLYQGAVNEGRLFELLIPGMQWVNRPLWIFGDGNFLTQATELIQKYQLENKVFLKGKLLPGELKNITSQASIGFTLFENNGLSNYFSLANRFFDYVHAVTPQVCVDFPVYHALNKELPVAVLIDTTDPATLADEINSLLADTERYRQLQINCLQRRNDWNWNREETVLLEFYKKIFSASAAG